MHSPEELAAELERRFAALLRATLRSSPRELSRTATSVLAALRDRGPCRVTELAAAEAVAQPTMTTLIGRLERDGYVRRAADADDRRAVRVSITDDGREVLDRSTAAHRTLLGSQLAALDADDRVRIAAALPALDRLVHALEDTRS